jgi:hypothetical protein
MTKRPEPDLTERDAQRKLRVTAELPLFGQGPSITTSGGTTFSTDGPLASTLRVTGTSVFSNKFAQSRFDPPLARASDPTTSHQGEQDIQPRRRSQKQTLLAIYKAYPKGLTDEEAGGIAGFACWKRCAELRNDARSVGLEGIRATGAERIGRSGSAGMVCAYVPATTP